MKSKSHKKTARPVVIEQNGQTLKMAESQVLSRLSQVGTQNLSAAMLQSEKIQHENPHAEKVRAFYYQTLCDLELKQKLLQSTDAKLAKSPRDKLALSYKSHGLRLSGKVDEAASVLEKLLKLDPADANTLNSLGSAIKELGDFERANTLFDRAITLKPTYGKAYWNRSNISSNPDQDLEQILKLLSSDLTPKQEQHYLHFTAYRILEKNGNYEDAFKHLEQGNQLKRENLNYKVEDDLRIDSNIRDFFTDAFFKSQKASADTADSPIFIFGMPRSGTTLVEQIIASHSQVQGGNELSALGDATREIQRLYRLSGEFPQWTSKLPPSGWEEIGKKYLDLTSPIRANKPYLTDKALLNYKVVGLIRLCLPNAKLILVDRNPMDLCFGCYRQLFSEGLKFSYSFKDLAKIYASYQQMMAHWEQVLPGFVLRVQYEDLVADPETQIQTILDFCKLQHEDDCFQPHNTRRAVRTLSATQVREPIFKRGVNRWVTYESQLQPLSEALSQEGISV